MTLYEETIARAQAHVQHQRLYQGLYQVGFTHRGCSIGCHAIDLGLEPGNHIALAKALEWPVWLVHIQDEIFEELDPKYVDWWHVEIAKAAKPPVPESVLREFLAWLIGQEAVSSTTNSDVQNLCRYTADQLLSPELDREAIRKKMPELPTNPKTVGEFPEPSREAMVIYAARVVLMALEQQPTEIDDGSVVSNLISILAIPHLINSSDYYLRLAEQMLQLLNQR